MYCAAFVYHSSIITECGPTLKYKEQIAIRRHHDMMHAYPYEDMCNRVTRLLYQPASSIVNRYPTSICLTKLVNGEDWGFSSQNFLLRAG